MGKNSTFTLVIRLIAGAYIIYLGYQLIKGVVTGESTENPTLMMVFGIAFIVIGAFLIIDAVRKQLIGNSETAEEVDASERAIEKEVEAEEKEIEEEAEKAAEGEAEEGAPKVMTIAERIKRLSSDEPEESGEQPEGGEGAEAGESAEPQDSEEHADNN